MKARDSLLLHVLKEPLLHFLAIGVALFIVSEIFTAQEEQTGDSTIVITKEKLLTFMQYREKNFNEALFVNRLETFDDKQRQTLVDHYKLEEVLYRKAKALGVDKNDYFARQRMIQQASYIIRSTVESTVSLSEDELQAYLHDHKDKYYVPPKITFTHVFYRVDNRSVDKAKTRANEKRLELNAVPTPFHQSIVHGDRFLYHRNYVDKEKPEIASHFGQGFQEKLFSLQADNKQWQGPFLSKHGVHLVLVTKQQAGYDPQLDDIRGRLQQDALQERIDTDYRQLIQSMANAYSVKIVGSLQ